MTRHNKGGHASPSRGVLLLVLLAVAAVAAYLVTTRLPRGTGRSGCTTAAITAATLTTNSSNHNSNNVPPACEPSVIYRGPAGLPPLRTRDVLGTFLQARKLKDGAEVGVQSGVNAQRILSQWPSCQSFKLIDVWAHQENYKDFANVDNGAQQGLFEQTQANLAQWNAITKYYRMLSTEAAKQIPDNSLDFIYVDARHDYCGVKEDLDAYYPKLRPGGILAGHDYLDAPEVILVTPDQDWSVCMDGTVQKGAVKGAVEAFALEHGLVVSVMYADGAWASWMVQKPTTMSCVQEMGDWGSQVSP